MSGSERTWTSGKKLHRTDLQFFHPWTFFTSEQFLSSTFEEEKNFRPNPVLHCAKLSCKEIEKEKEKERERERERESVSLVQRKGAASKCILVHIIN